MPTSKPNVLLITADHFRGDAIHAAGAYFLHTPNLDALCAQGVRFCNASTSNPICVPARATITTGCHSHRATRTTANGGRIRDEETKLAEHFGAHGYETYALGKLHYVPYGDPHLLHGFKTAELCEEGRAVWQKLQGADVAPEHYHEYLRHVGWGGMQRAHGIGNNDVHAGPSPLPEEHYVDSWVTTRSLHHLSEHQRRHPDKPFLMWTSFIKPHPPYDPPMPYDRFYDPRAIPLPRGGPEDLEHMAPALRVRRDTYGWDRMGVEGVQYSRAHYFGLITFLDKQIGRLMRALDEHGLRQNTIVLFLADHGDLLGDYGVFFKGNFMSGSVHVPFIVSWPTRMPAGEVHDRLVGSEDVLPTLCDYTGIPLPENLHGHSLRQELGDPFNGGREYYVSETRCCAAESRMVRDRRWKYIYSELAGFEELYDMEADPYEEANVATKQPDRVARMREQLIEWCRQTEDPFMLRDEWLIKREPDYAAMTRLPHNVLGWRPY